MATILITDDDAAVRMMCAGMLSNHQCIEADNGHTALQQYHNHAIDLVLTDLVMPEMNGLALIRSLTNLDADVRIVAITGSSADDEQRVRLAKDFPHIPTLEKPFTLQTLLELVRPLLP